MVEKSFKVPDEIENMVSEDVYLVSYVDPYIVAVSKIAPDKWQQTVTSVQREILDTNQLAAIVPYPVMHPFQNRYVMCFFVMGQYSDTDFMVFAVEDTIRSEVEASN